MKILLKNATVVDVDSQYHKQKVDLLISEGIITKIEKNSIFNCDYQVVESPDLHVSQGWFDSSVSFGEPGFEDRESIANGLKVAAKSGFTAVALQPNSYPIIDNQSQIQFVKQKAKNTATQLFPIGALTKNAEGKDIAELFDMKNSGAIAFGDYNKSISNANLMKIALQYVQDFDGLLLAFCEDENIKGSGVVNEGAVATQLGLKGIANLAEDLQVERNLLLLQYTGGKMHIPTISTAKSVELIRSAKAQGLRISCSVAIHNLVLTDSKIQTFDSRFKLAPPLRTEIDRQALLAGILDNTIDCITSDHNPIDIEHKKVEFDFAKNGTIGLESAFAALLQILPLDVVIQKLTAAKSIFGVPSAAIEVGNMANLSLFITDEKWIFSKENILSKSKNSAFLGCEMKGKPVGIVNQNKLILA